MAYHQATEITVVVERILQEKVCRLLEEGGATGYTVIEGSGKGRDRRRSGDRPAVVGAFAIVKIEAIIGDRAAAEAVAEKIAATYFQDYSGIVYLEPVEVLRPQRF